MFCVECVCSAKDGRVPPSYSRDLRVVLANDFIILTLNDYTSI